MSNRRTFLRNTGVSTLGAAFLTQSTLSSFSRLAGIAEKDAADMPVEFCDVVRPEDFLCLRIYFYNLHLNRFFGHLKVTDRDRVSYLLIQLRPQHVAEEVKDFGFDERCEINFPADTNKWFSKSLTPGFSNLTLAIPKDVKYIPFHADDLLDWNRYRVTTLDDPEMDGKYPAGLPFNAAGHYPFKKGYYPDELNVGPSGFRVPVTLIEAPFKMWMSPRIPENIDDKRSSYRYLFAHSNGPRTYYAPSEWQRLSELWNNSLFYSQFKDDGTHGTLNAPHLRVVAYEDTKDAGISLLPNAEPHSNVQPPYNSDRSILAWLGSKLDGNRDIATDYFNFSSLGLSSFYHYRNMNDEGHEIVEWNQEIKLGRDNFVEIVIKGIDLKTGFKVLLSQIAERRIEKGKSLLIKRFKYRYLDPKKDYSGEEMCFNNIVYKTITPLTDGSYFHPMPLPGCDAGSYEQWPGFIALNECNPQYPDRLLKVSYTGTDADQADHFLSLDLCFVKESTFCNPTLLIQFIQEYNRIIATDPNHVFQHAIHYNKEKIAYVSAGEVDGSYDNTELATDEMQFYPVLNSLNFDDVNPVLPKLKYISFYPSQLEGIEGVPVARYANFSSSFTQHKWKPENWTKIFLQVLSSDIRFLAIEDSEEVLDIPAGQVVIKPVIDEIARLRTPITDVFTENYQRVGQLINPDIVISDLSALRQALTMAESMNVTPELKKSLNPSIILRGAHVEIVGGIDLLKILKTVIPIDNSPVFRVIQNAGTEIGNAAESVKTAFDDLNKKIDGIRGDIQAYQADLKKYENQISKTYSEKLLKASNILRKVEEWQLQVTMPEGSLQLYEHFFSMKKKAGEYLVAFMEATTTPATENFRLINAEYIKLRNFWNDQYDNIKKLIAHQQILNAVSLVITQKTNAIQKHVRDYPNVNTAALKKDLGDFVALQARLRTIFSDDQGLVDQIFNSLVNMMTTARLIINNTTRATLLLGLRGKMTIMLDDSIEVMTGDFPDGPVYNAGTSPAITIQTLLTGAGIITLRGGQYMYELNNDLSGWNQWLQKEGDTLKSLYIDLYKLFTDGFNDLYRFTDIYLLNTSQKWNSEKTVLEKQLSNQLVTELSNDGGKIQNAIYQLEGNTKVRETFFHFQKIYLDYHHIKVSLDQVAAQIGGTITFPEWANNSERVMLDAVRAPMTSYLTLLLTDPAVSDLAGVQKIIDYLNTVHEDALTDINLFDAKFNALFNGYNQAMLAMNNLIDAERQQVQQMINDAQKKLKEYRDQLATIAEKISNKTIEYTWETEDFNDIDLGIIRFICGKQTPTRLNVDVSTTLHFDFTQLPPKPAAITVRTLSSITNFSLTFLEILTLDFDKIGFIAQTGQKDQFDVQVRDVHFEGPLNFVQVFQSYLKTLDKGLNFDIGLDGVMLGYQLSIPSITGGAFNFVNASLVMNFHLPFKARVPMRLDFGLSTPQSLFLVSGSIFGGRGCLVIGVDPKQGIVLIILIIEVGAVLYLDLGVAQGIVYLFAGIYIKKDHDNVTINGYLTCGGALDILGIITVSVTFYMGLEGNGKYLEGYCSLSIDIDIAFFIHISVSLSMYKRIYGCPDNNAVPDQASGSKSVFLGIRSGGAGSVGQPVADAANDLADIGSNEIVIDGNEAYWDKYFSAYYHPIK